MARPRKKKCPYCDSVPDGMVCDECGGDGLTGPCRTSWTDGATNLVCVLMAGHKGNHKDERGWKFSGDDVKNSVKFMAKSAAQMIQADIEKKSSGFSLLQ